MRNGYLLALDVGGTKTDVALGALGEAWPGIVAEHVYASQQFETLEALISAFLQRNEVRGYANAVRVACVSVAGPVEEQSATTTNLDWKFGARALGEGFGFPTVRLINDFAAAAIGIARLEARDLEILQAGTVLEHGTQAVVGAGTGLGVAMMTWDGTEYRVHPSEAGHMDFAPLDALQDGLLAWLRQEYGRVSYERVVSGSGLAHIYSYLKESGIAVPSQALVAAVAHESDPAAAVSEFGLDGRDPLAVQALEVFATAYGAFTGDIALAVLARGGVYIAGGIAPKIAPKLKDGAFVRAFVGKGRFSPLLATIPVRLVMNPKVGLYGALELARRLAMREKASPPRTQRMPRKKG